MKAAAAACAICITALACRPAPSEPVNLVLVVVDTLRQDHVSAYGYGRETTPFLDRLAAEGCRADGRASTSWTRPSTATILSGLHPLEHQVISPNDLVPESVPLLAEAFAAKGFATLAIVANSVVSKKWGFGRGFSTFVDLQQELARVPTSEELNHRTAALLDALEAPYFLYFHSMDPHLPYEPEVGGEGEPLSPEAQRWSPVTERFFSAEVALPRTVKMAIARELYDGEVRRADGGVRGLWQALESRGLAEGTLLVVTSDHGEEILDHGGFSHGRTLYEEVLRVPLLFRGPGAERVCSETGIFPLEDLAPTLRELFRVEPSAASARFGRARVPAPVEGARERSWLGHLDFVEGAALALRHDEQKLILGAVPYRKELFDLARDPSELENLFDKPAAAPNDDIARELAARYNELARAAHSRASTRDEENVAQLRALGYLGASQKPQHDRRFPPRIAPADRVPRGLRGWEAALGTSACATRDSSGRTQELWGWKSFEEGTGDRMGIFLARAPSAAGWLVVAGGVQSPDGATLIISIDGQQVGTADVAGEFELPLAVTIPPGREPVAVEIEVQRRRGRGVRPSGPILSIEFVCLRP